MARLAAQRGEPEAVEPAFQRAASIFGEIETPFHLAVTLLEHGEWLIGQGCAEGAQPLLADARNPFERLEAKPWLERLDAAAADSRAELPA